MEIFIGVVAAAVVIYLLYNMFRNRKKRMEDAAKSSDSAAATGLSVSKDLFEAELGHHPPLESFHVVGNEARVTFDVPLQDEEDSVLNDLLVGEGVEVVRQKRHELPISDIEEIVVFAGRGQSREVGRTKLASPGELPPPALAEGMSIAAVAHDPFAAPFDDDDDRPPPAVSDFDPSSDELGPIRDELNFPMGLERGLRATGTDPASLNGPELVVALLKMFGYRVTEQSYEGTYMATKDGISTYIATEAHTESSHPELSEGAIQRFVAAFGSSGADRGMMITDKYGPFKIYEIERNQPKVRFVTRERLQRFIDSMALG